MKNINYIINKYSKYNRVIIKITSKITKISDYCYINFHIFIYKFISNATKFTSNTTKLLRVVYKTLRWCYKDDAEII